MNRTDLPPGTNSADLSALMDGEVDVHAAGLACAAWRAEARQRDDWHTWHLIGDVLRSEELAAAPVHDEAFLSRLRSRLATEPVILAPTAALAPALPAHADAAAELPVVRPAHPGPSRSNRQRLLRRWAAPMGMAAGVVMVAGAVLVTRPDAGMGLSLAGNALPQAGVAASAAIVIDRNAVDDAQLARYLSAHKEFPAAAALGPSPGFLRNAAYESSPR